ncbi:MAG: DUF547 domain-containing protein [Candidatus Obscuribacterales bacterium]|nr:DUF547 domain-containing protein [Candidatus Obscuribacterales bacterium]
MIFLPARSLVLAFVLSILCQSAFAFDKQHRLFTAELKKYVHAGCVDYAAWKKSPQQLDAYLDGLAGISTQEYEALGTAEKKALWLNGYNAFTIKIVLDHYPLHGNIDYYPADSLRQIPDVWEKYHFKIAGRNVDLDDVEHGVIRREFHDPRMHFAVVCAARGAAPLCNQAFTAEDIDAVLEGAKNAYLSDTNNLRFDEVNNVLLVSRVFSWFPLDFAPANFFKGRTTPPSDFAVILAYLASNGPPDLVKKLARVHDLNDIKVSYLSYDWSLNDCYKN